MTGVDERLRQTLKQMYPGEMWSKKVDRMSREQVYSIVRRIEEEQKAREETHVEPEETEIEQLTLF